MELHTKKALECCKLSLMDALVGVWKRRLTEMQSYPSSPGFKG